jgi:Pectate lyase superfamily protein
MSIGVCIVSCDVSELLVTFPFPYSAYGTLLTLALFPAFVAAQPMTAISCGADPSGHSDSTAAFQECLKRLPAGDLLVPYGTYKITAPLFKSRNQSLIGMGSKASVLKCENTRLPCIVAADTSGGPNNYSISAIQNLGIEGPGVTNQSVGVLLGGDPTSAVISKAAFGDSVNFDGVRITGFNHGVQWGNNAWSNKFFQCTIFGNGSGLFAPKGLQNSGEAISVTDSNIFNNAQYGIEDNANFEWMIQGSSFDYNSTAIMFLGSYVHIANCHFEQQSAQLFFEPYGQGTLSIKDTELLVQASTGQDKYILSVWPQSLNITIDDVSVWSNHPVEYFMRVQGQIDGTINNLHGNGNKKISALSDLASHAIISGSQAF